MCVLYTQITVKNYPGAIANTGKRALSFVYDDYRPDAKPVNGISLGNGNLMYTVSHDAQTGKHSARFEAYTSFNMPREISYSNIGAEIDPNLATTAATVGYGCMSTVGVLAGANCVASYTETVPALVGSYSCPTGITSTVSGSTCNMVKTVASVKVGIYGGLVIDTCHTGFVLASTGCTQSYSVTATPSSYTCSGVTSTTPAPAGASTSAWTLSGAGASSSCTRTVTYISAASAVYSCPAGQTKLGTGIGSVCRAIIGATPVYACPAGYSAQSAGCVSTATNGASLQAGSVRYFHTDHLGSVTAITDETGLVVERLAYDAWGKRRFTNGTADVNDTVVGLTTDRGYTEHEMLDELGIIHMNGRVYDPTIGRFMSADPFIQAPYELQSHNRYAYVMNNPLLYTDPSGYWSFKSFFKFVVVAVAVVYTAGAATSWLLSGLAGTGGTAFATFSAFGAAQLTTLGAMTVGAAAGFVGGFLGTALNGGNFEQSVKAGVIGGVTGAAFAFVGQAFTAGSWQNYLGHAVVGCGSSVASGGGSEGCARGAASALIGKAVTNNTSGENWNDFSRGVAATVTGGVTSHVMGGSFANGAQTAAYGYLFNYCQSVGCFNELKTGLNRFFSSFNPQYTMATQVSGSVNVHMLVAGASYSEGLSGDTNGQVCRSQQACLRLGPGAMAAAGLQASGSIKLGRESSTAGDVTFYSGVGADVAVGASGFGGQFLIGSDRSINSAIGIPGAGAGYGGSAGLDVCVQRIRSCSAPIPTKR